MADDIQSLNGSYDMLMLAVKLMLAEKPSTTEWWRACRMLGSSATGMTDSMNFAAACELDCGARSNFRLPMFGRVFGKSDVCDGMPYSPYRTFMLECRKFE